MELCRVDNNAHVFLPLLHDRILEDIDDLHRAPCSSPERVDILPLTTRSGFLVFGGARTLC
jgi:hypothetical protein